MAEKSTDKTPESKGESPEPKRLYIAFYDPYTEKNDKAFERAAKTWKAGIEGAPGFRPGIDEVMLLPAGSDTEFKLQWDYAAVSATREKFLVREIIQFGHASQDRKGNKFGVEYSDKYRIDTTGFNKDTTLTAEDLGTLRPMPLHPKAFITLTGCNSANISESEKKESIAKAFAQTFRVPTLGAPVDSVFSEQPDTQVRTNTKSPNMYLYPYVDGKPIRLALYNEKGELVPELKHDPYFTEYGIKTKGPMTLADRQAHYRLQETQRIAKEAVPLDSLPPETARTHLPLEAWKAEGFAPRDGEKSQWFSVKDGQGHTRFVQMYPAKSVYAVDPANAKDPKEVAEAVYSKMAGEEQKLRVQEPVVPPPAQKPSPNKEPDRDGAER